MMFLHSEKVQNNRSIRQNRSRYSLFRVLTRSYQSVNMPVFSAIFNGFRLRMSEQQQSPATIWKSRIVPPEVPGQKLKAAVAMARERLVVRIARK